MKEIPLYESATLEMIFKHFIPEVLEKLEDGSDIYFPFNVQTFCEEMDALIAKLSPNPVNKKKH